MDDFLNSPIIDVIKKYPEVGILLEENGIGCVTCSVGTCLLKDVLKIHYMPEKQAHVLMKKIELIIGDQRDLSESESWLSNANADQNEIPAEETIQSPRKSEKKKLFGTKEEVSSDPLEELVREHNYIKKVLEVIPAIIKESRETKKIDLMLLSELVSFVKNYADKYHHAKEESILFGYASADFAPIKAMLEEHETGRYFIKTAQLEAGDGNLVAVAESLQGYMELLQGHIHREDNVLYPWFERNMDNKQIDEMAQRFSDTNRSFGEGYSKDYEQWADEISARYKV